MSIAVGLSSNPILSAGRGQVTVDRDVEVAIKMIFFRCGGKIHDANKTNIAILSKNLRKLDV